MYMQIGKSADGGYYVALRMEFTKFDDAHSFNIELIELLLQYKRRIHVPYNYSDHWC